MLLVVEDDVHLLQGIRDILEIEGYRVLTASSGLDGLDVCRRLRASDTYIPILMLTARSSEVDRVLGLELGADDYVAKPFDVEELRIRIRNLIEQRQLLAERFAQLEVVRPGGVSNPVQSADDRFLAKIREAITENLGDPDFRVEALCREIGMSRTQLHRKLKAVAGRSAGDFVRMERLNKAAEMLGDGEANVTEVAYSVGYRSLSQFAKAFREQFGMAPSDFEA